MSHYYNHIDQAFEAFKKSKKNDWIKKAKLDLAGKNIEQIFSGKPREGLQIFPFYTEEDLPPSLPAAAKADVKWDYHECVPLYSGFDAKDINAAIMQALQMEASGIDFYIQNEVHLTEELYSELLNQVQVLLHPVSFYVKHSQLDVFEAFLTYAEGLRLNGTIRGTLNIYPEINHLESSKNIVPSLTKFFNNPLLDGYRLLGISSAPFVNAGASVVQELAFTLSYLVTCIDDLTRHGIELTSIFDHQEISLSTQSHYFLDIAKFRAIRILLSQIAEAYQMKDRDPHHWNIKAVSGTWNKTVYDPVSNMLRNTTEAMAAIIGGCNTLSLLPHDFAYENKRRFGSRMARNISHLLLYEAQLGNMADPAAGSYFLEQLTHQLVTEAWQEFLSIEQVGGYTTAVKQGTIAKRMADNRSQKQKDIKTRRQPFVGATRYLNPDESLASVALYPGMMQETNRGPALFEQLRYQVDQYVAQGKGRPSVGIFIFPVAGEMAFINARLAFIKDLLVCAGISFEEHVYVDKKDFAAQATDTHVWILSSTNQFYDHRLPTLIKQSSVFRNKVLYVAGVSQMPLETLQESGIHDRIYAGADLHKILTDILHQLDIVA